MRNDKKCFSKDHSHVNLAKVCKNMLHINFYRRRSSQKFFFYRSFQFLTEAVTSSPQEHIESISVNILDVFCMQSSKHIATFLGRCYLQYFCFIPCCYCIYTMENICLNVSFSLFSFFLSIYLSMCARVRLFSLEHKNISFAMERRQDEYKKDSSILRLETVVAI